MAPWWVILGRGVDFVVVLSFLGDILATREPQGTLKGGKLEKGHHKVVPGASAPRPPEGTPTP